MAFPAPPSGDPIYGQYGLTDALQPSFGAGDASALSQWSGTYWAAVQASDLYVNYTSAFSVDMATFGSITNLAPQSLATPPDANTAATVSYVQQYANSVATGLQIKDSCVAASETTINLASAPATIGGYSPTSGDRILVAGQGGNISTPSAANGIYIFNGTGSAMTRSSDALAGSLATGAYTLVTGGTYAGIGYVCSAAGGTDFGQPIAFTEFLIPVNYTAGDGITILSNVVSVNKGNGLAFVSDGATNALAVLANPTNATISVASAGLSVIVDPAGAIVKSGGSGLAVQTDANTISINGSDQIQVNTGAGLKVGTGIEVDYGNGLALSGNALIASVDGASIINNGGSGSQLQVNLKANSGLSISGGLHAVAGAGISVGADIAINLGSNSGLSTASGLVAVAGNGISITSDIAVNYGAGLTLSGSQLVVNAGSAITTSGGAVNVLLDSNSGLQTSAGLKVVAGSGINVGANVSINLAVASGLNLTAGLAVTPGDGIQLDSNAVAVKLAANPGLTVSGGSLAVLLATSASSLTTVGGLQVIPDNTSIHNVGAGAGALAIKLAASNPGLSITSGLAVGAGTAIDVSGANVNVKYDGDTIGINGSNQLQVNAGNGLYATGSSLAVAVDGATIINNGGTGAQIAVRFDSNTLSNNGGSGPLAVNFGNGLSDAGGSLAVLADPNASNPTISVGAAGIKVNLGSQSGLTSADGGLEVLANPSNATITVASAGLSVRYANGLTAVSAGLQVLPDPNVNLSTFANIAVGSGGVSVKYAATGGLVTLSSGLAVNAGDGITLASSNVAVLADPAGPVTVSGAGVNVAVSAPAIISANAITVQPASASQDGYLSSADYTTIQNLGGTLAGTATQASAGTTTIASLTLPPNSMGTVRVLVSLFGGSGAYCASYIIEGGFYMGNSGSPSIVGATAFMVSQRGGSVNAGSIPGFSVASGGIVNVTGTYAAGQTGSPTFKWAANGMYSVAQ